MKILCVLAVAAITIRWSPPIPAQTAPDPSNMAVRVGQARKANAALMRQYSWTSRTDVMDQGQVKDIRIDTVNYGPDGQLQRSVVNDQSSPLPLGFVRRRIVEFERKKVEEYLVGLRGLLEQYTLPTAGKVQEFMNTAVATGAGGVSYRVVAAP
jgi:hypothetical protein